MRRLTATERADFLRAGIFAGLQPHPGDHDLSQPFVRQPQHAGLGDFRVGLQQILDFLWGNIFAAANDHVLGAAGEDHVAILAHHSQIAGMQPAARVDGLARRLRLAVVTLHGEIAAGADFALLAQRHRFAAGHVGDFYFGVGHGSANRGGALFGAGFLVAHGHRGRRFGLAVGVVNFPRPELLLEALNQFAGTRRAAGQQQTNRLDIEALEVWLLQQREVHRGNREQRRDFLLVDRLERGPRIKHPRGQHQRRAHKQRAERSDRVTCAVVQRKSLANAIVLRQAQTSSGQLRVVHQIVMRQLDSLGIASGARGVLQIGHGVRLDRGGRQGNAAGRINHRLP